MSIQAISWVLDESRAEGMDRLIMICLANGVNKDDSLTYQSTRTVAAMARCSTTTVTAALRRLCELGELERVTMGDSRNTAKYRFTFRPGGSNSVTDLTRSTTPTLVDNEPNSGDSASQIWDAASQPASQPASHQLGRSVTTSVTAAVTKPKTFSSFNHEPRLAAVENREGQQCSASRSDGQLAISTAADGAARADHVTALAAARRALRPLDSTEPTEPKAS